MTTTLNHRELVKKISEKNGISAYRVEKVFEALADELHDADADTVIKIRGVGSFTKKEVPSREVYVPSTGSTTQSTAHSDIKFRPVKNLR
jgi:nucleoid DNA-binding protein